MVVGVCRIELGIWSGDSLKGKRSVVKRVIHRTRQKFNVAMAEVDDLDLWQKATLGFCCIANDQRFVNSMLDKILDYIEGLGIAELLGQEMEFITY
jgi:hypothetical protein